MATITDYFEQAQLSLAAYALDLTPGIVSTALRDRLIEAGMSEAAAIEFASNYSVVDQFTDPISGFSGTVFAKDGVNYLAIRGSEDSPFAGVQDWLLNVNEIGPEGIAVSQGVAMFNWMQRLYAVDGSAVVQYFYNSSLGTLQTFSATGSGYLAGSSAPISATGHSLGGHLAMMMSRLIPTLVNSVYTYNAPGFDSLIGRDLFPLTSEGFFELLRNASIGPITGAIGTVWNPDIMTHWYVEGDVVHSIGNTPGTQGVIFSETSNQGVVDAHSITQINDALAIYDLFAKLDPAVEASRITEILSAASHRSADSLEAALDGLRRLFTGATDSTPTDREQYWARIVALRPTMAAASGPLTVSSLAQQSASELVVRAQAANGLAYRYALHELNPFAILGPDEFYALRNANGGLDLYATSEQTPAGMTSEYVIDRAGFLAAKNAANLVDATSVVFTNQTDNWGYVDLAQRYSVTAFGEAPASIRRFAIFGASSSDGLQGGAFADRLYGGRGADVLTGGKANDYLEGGAGMDLYAYAGETSIFAPNTNDGNDELRDTDGRGLIRYTFTGSGTSGTTSRVIGGAALKISPTEWQSPDGKFTYTQQFEGLLVSINGDAGGSIRILDFNYDRAASDGYLGIRFVDPLSAPGSPTRTFYGDKQDWDSDVTQDGVQTQPDAFGNVLRADGQDGRLDLVQADRADTFYGSAADDAEKFNTAGGDDVVYGDGPSSFTSSSGGRDLVEAGAGRDIVTAGAGNDWVEGGSGADVLGGNLGNDTLFGDATAGQTLTLAQAIAVGETGGQAIVPGDLISGDAGDDVVVGSAIADLIYGGEGADVIVGGAGTDNIYGDGILTAAGLDWTATRTVTVTGDVRNYVLSTANVVVSHAADIGSADVIYGGSGADWMFGGAGDDYLEGGNSAADANVDDDVLFGEAGSDILLGGSGKDSLHGDSASVDLAALSGDDYLDGGAGDDELIGYKGDDILIGGDGVDTLVGGEGDDLIWGGSGDDIILGGAGTDSYVYHRGDGKDLVRDPDIESGSDYLSSLVLGSGIAKSDVTFRLGSLVVDFGAGDAIHFDGFNPDDPVSTRVLDAIHFADGEVMTYEDVLAQGFDLDGTEVSDTITGTAVTDRIDGKSGGDKLFGRGGDDAILGGAGRDAIDGGVGNDVLDGGDDADAIEGGAGDDSIVGGLADDVLTGGDGSDSIDGGADNDFIDGQAGADALQGGSGNDAIKGGADGDEIAGGDGDDRLEGDDGNDSLAGDAGDDTIIGNGGDDTLAGGAGSDTLIGGAGADTYVYALGDGSDLIDDQSGLASEIDTLSFAEGIGVADVSLCRLNGDLIARISDGNTLTVRGMYIASSGNVIERVQFADGTVIDAAALEALPTNVLIGSAAADTLVGSGPGDRIEGRGGDDFLDGGPGNDTLIGGAGTDRYRLAYNTNQDTVIEAAGEASVVVLDAGVALTDVHATRTGNDLVLNVRGTEHSLTVQGYFALAGQVTVAEAGGATSTAENILAATQSQQGSREALKESARIAHRAALFGNLLFTSGEAPNGFHGLHAVDASTLARDDYSAFTATFSQSQETVTTTFISASGTSTVSTQQNVFTDWDWQFPQGGVFSYVARWAPQVFESDDSVISVTHGDTVQLTGSQRWVEFDWEIPISGASAGQRVDVFPFQGGLLIHEYDTRDYFGTARGTTSYAGEGPFGSLEGLFPRYKLVGVDIHTWTMSPTEVIGGPGANTISGAYIADGGAGDDTISAEALALGGDGNDLISGANAVYGEAGDDRLSGSGSGIVDGGSGNDVLRGHGLLLPGSGNDLVIGSFGSVIRIGSADIGEKIVWGGSRLELPIEATQASLSLSWSSLDPSSELGQQLDLPHLTLDLSWGTGSTARIVRPRQFGPGPGVDRVRFGDGTEVSVDQLAALLPRDAIFGTPLADGLHGDYENDSLFGLGGDDVIRGWHGDDILDGGAGNDVLIGGESNDTYVFRAGEGNDSVVDSDTVQGNTDTLRLTGGITGSDLLVEHDDNHRYVTLIATGERVTLQDWVTDPNARIERIEFDGGVVWTAAEFDARSIYIGDGEVIFGTDAAETLTGTPGPDYIGGRGGNDNLFGLAGDDELDGGQGDDFIVGGPGDDTLYASPGADTFLLEPGGGHDVIDSPFSGGHPNNNSVVRVADGLTPDDVVLTRSQLHMRASLPASGTSIQVMWWFSSDPLRRLAGLLFSDGTFWNADEMEARLTPSPATDGDDEIFGSSEDEVINALAGSDSVFADAGDDVLDGGGGNDYLQGDAGNDVLRGGADEDDVEDWEGHNLLDGGAGNDYLYHEGRAFMIGGQGDDFLDNRGPGGVIAFNPGDGNDTIYAADSFTLSLGGGITPADLSLHEDGVELVLSIGTESVRLSPSEAPRVWPVITLQMFGSVHTYDFNAVIADFYAARNADPTLNDFALDGVLQAHHLGSSDTDAIGGVVAYRYGTTGTLDGLSASNIQQALANTDFGVAAQTVSVSGGNQVPTLDNPIADQGASEDTSFTFQVPAGTFSDPDAGDTLGYAATLADGSALPTWIAFNAETRSFTGTPANGDVGNFDVRVTAVDTAGASVSDVFRITVNNTSDAPTVANPIADQNAAEDAAFSFTVPLNSFAEIDGGDTLTYTAANADGSALPGWLYFDATIRTFTGTPLNANVGSIDVKVTATDSTGESVSDTFTLAVANTNDAPTVANPIADQLATEDSAFSFTVPMDVFADVDAGDTLTYSASLADGSALPSWLSLNPGTRTFSGTPLNVDVGSIDVRVTASDGASASASDTFIMTVANANDAPTLTNAFADQAATQDAAFSFTVPANTFADVDAADSLVHSVTLADGSALPSWLSFDATTRTFSGTPLNADVGPVDVKVTATDSASASVSDIFRLTVANTNDAPTVANPIAGQNATEDVPFSFTLSANTFADVDAEDSLVYSATLADGSALPAWLSFNGTSRTFSGVPLDADVGTLDVRVTAMDSVGSSGSDVFTLAVAGANNAPTVSNPIADQLIDEGEPWALVVPAQTFADVDPGEQLALSATLSSGAPLPSWLSFDAQTRTFSGTPPH